MEKATHSPLHLDTPPAVALLGQASSIPRTGPGRPSRGREADGGTNSTGHPPRGGQRERLRTARAPPGAAAPSRRPGPLRRGAGGRPPPERRLGAIGPRSCPRAVGPHRRPPGPRRRLPGRPRLERHRTGQARDAPRRRRVHVPVGGGRGSGPHAARAARSGGALPRPALRPAPPGDRRRPLPRRPQRPHDGVRALPRHGQPRGGRAAGGPAGGLDARRLRNPASALSASNRRPARRSATSSGPRP